MRRHEGTADMMLIHPFGAIYESFRVRDLDCFLVHSHTAHYDHRSDVLREGVIVYLHGGAFVSGSAKFLHRFMAHLHNLADLPVLGVDYHLAPEYPLQHGQLVRDGLDIVVEYLHTQMGVALNDIFLIGDSAGGAAVMMLMLELSKQGLGDIGGGVMMSPGIDIDNDATQAPSLMENAAFDVFLSMAGIEMFKEYVFGCRDVKGKLSPSVERGNVTRCVEQ